MPVMKLWMIAIAALTVSSCGDGELVKGQRALLKHVENGKVGNASDQWIEMKNAAGEWERVGLIFGYTDDFAECAKAIEGLKRANDYTDYRCIPAN